MANNANEENPFQDLLSAALSESGLTDDFDLSGFGAEAQPTALRQPVPIQTITVPRQTAAAQRLPVTVQRQAVPRQTITVQRQGVQRQPMEVQRLPLTVQRQPANVQRQPISVQRAVQRQPHTIQRQPLTVQRQPLAVQRQPLTLQRQPLTVQRQPLTLHGQVVGQKQLLSPATATQNVRTAVGQSPQASQNVVRPSTPIVRVNARGQQVIQTGTTLGNTPTIRVQAGQHIAGATTPTVRINPPQQSVVYSITTDTPQGRSPLMSSTIAAQVSTTPASSSLKKNIIHIVTPNSSTGVVTSAPQGISSVKRVLQMQGSGQAVSSSGILQGANKGAIKVIQLASPKNSTAAPHNAVTLSGGDGKTYKIVTIKSANSSTASQDGVTQKITLPAGATSGANVARNIVKMLPSRSGAPLRATIVTAGTVIASSSPTIVSTPASQQHVSRVLSSQTTLSPSVSQVRMPGTGQPIIIRSPGIADGVNSSGKTFTKVLKIIKPSISSVNTVNSADNQQPAKIVHVSTPAIHQSAQSISQPIVTVASSHTAVTLPFTVTSSQTISEAPVSRHEQSMLSSTVSSASPASHMAVVDQNVTVMAGGPSSQISTPTPIQATPGAQTITLPTTLDDLVASKTEDEKVALDALNFLSDSKPDLTQSVNVVKTETSTETQGKGQGQVEPMEIDQNVMNDIKAEIRTEIKTEVKTEDSSEVIGSVSIKEEVKTELKTEMKDEPPADIKQETDVGWDMFGGGGGDLDLFSQALQQLSDTNAKAKIFEEEEKMKHHDEEEIVAKSSLDNVAPEENLLKTAVEASNIQPTSLQDMIANRDSGYRTINVQNMDTGSGRNSPNIIQLSQSGLTQPGRVQSPVTIVQRVGSPLTLSRPGSPHVIIQKQDGMSIVHTLGQTTPLQSTVYTTPGGSGSTLRQSILQGGTPGTPLSGLAQGTSIRRISNLSQLQNTSTIVTTTPSGQVIRRIIPTGSRISVPPGTPIPGAQKVTIGSVNQMSLLGASRTDTPGNGALPLKLTDREVSQLWANDDVKLKKIATAPVLSQLASAQHTVARSSLIEEEMEAEDEELGHAETYAEYMPAKLKVGIKHPDPVVETSSLASVEPANVFYRLSIPEYIIDSGALSALQLETIVYASQKHETFLPSGERAGFLVGDGAGVGKGRTIAGMIYENYLQGRKRALWLSVSNDLKIDAERDLNDIGAGKIEVHPLNKFKYAKISSHINNSVKKGVIFATYSSLIGESQAKGKYRTRLKQLLHWAGKDFDGAIIFDECHRAKNLFPAGSSKPTKTGLTVLELQKKLPNARIIYASATGASEPRNMAYMTRLGLWGAGTPFHEFTDFIQAIEKRGVGAMELVAMDMKLRGIYIARQLSFHGVSFNIKEIEIPSEFVKIYNSAVKLWVEARENFQRAAELISAEQRMRKTMWGQFWSSHQRFFKYLCMSAKVKYCVKLVRDAIKNGKCVVIGLQSTGEARTLEQLEESGGELNDFVSTAKGVLQSLVEKHFPAPDRKKTMDLFGWNSSIFDKSPAPSPKSGKRKKIQNDNDKKRMKTDWSDDSSSSSSSDSDGDEEMNVSTNKSTAKSASEESDLSLSDSSSDDEGDDNFNPFGNGSDSDDDPWLKKNKKNKEKKKKKKPPVEVKEEPKKKKKKEKKKKNKKEKKQKPASDSDDEFDDIDSQLDKMLVAAGLKKNGGSGATEKAEQKAPAKDCVQQAIDMKRDLLNKIEHLGDQLPPNTLDELIDQLGGPEYVAEMTGRKGRVVSNDDGYVQYESRSESDTPLELMNLAEKQRFMDGEKFIAIISEAASSGISLQADRRVANQRRRVHITLELPWSADRAVQQFGRTHRSNQVSAPEYLFLISKLAGEQRFASTVAKRLESLGALTHGDRRATETRDLSRFNIDNKFGRAALETVMKSVLMQEAPMVQPPENYSGNFFHDVKKGLIGVGMIAVDERTGYAVLEKEYNNISKFLNRILGMEVEVQNELFKYFTDTLAAVILQAKRNGRWDMGILDIGTGDDEVRTVDNKTFKGNFSGVNTRITLYTVSIERGMNWQKAMEVWREHDGSDDGFYLSKENFVGKTPPILAIATVGRKREKLYRLYRPNSGIQSRMESLEELKKKYKKVYPDDARYWWEDQYDSSLTICTHAYWRGSCRRAAVGLTCETGLRRRTYHVLSGSVLSVWTKVESVLATIPGGIASRMQIIRLRTEDNKKIVGTLIPDQALGRLEHMLSSSAAESPLKQIPYTPPQPRPNVIPFSPAGMGYRSSTTLPGNMSYRTMLPGTLAHRSNLPATLSYRSNQTSHAAVPSPSLAKPRTVIVSPDTMDAPSGVSQSSGSRLSSLPTVITSQPTEPAPKQYLSMPMFL